MAIIDPRLTLQRDHQQAQPPDILRNYLMPRYLETGPRPGLNGRMRVVHRKVATNIDQLEDFGEIRGQSPEAAKRAARRQRPVTFLAEFAATTRDTRSEVERPSSR